MQPADNWQIKDKKQPLLAALVWYAIMFWLFHTDPFFGDGISTLARGAMDIYENGLLHPFYKPLHDPGHPTLIPWLLAAIWKVTGPQLWVAHALNLLFGLGVLIGTFKTSFHFKLNPWIPCFLLAISPTFVSQSALLITHLPLTFFFLFAFLALANNQFKRFVFWSVLMVLTHLEGLFLIASLGVWYWWATQPFQMVKNAVKPILFTIPALIGFGIWTWIHFNQFGWALSSPNYANHRFTPGIFGVLTHIAIIIWRLIDLGYFVAYLILGAWIWNQIRTKTFQWHQPVVAFIIALCLVVLAVAITVNFHAGHRYFFPFTPFLMIFTATALNHLKHKKQWMVVLFAALIGGHFLFYPGKTMGDANLSYRGWFEIKKSIEAKFQGARIFTYAPISNPSKFTSLSRESVVFEGLYDKSMDSAQFVLVSNLNGEFTPTQLDSLKLWPAISFENGWVWATVYARPGQTQFDTTGWKVRKPGYLELKMQQFKSNTAP